MELLELLRSEARLESREQLHHAINEGPNRNAFFDHDALRQHIQGIHLRLQRRLERGLPSSTAGTERGLHAHRIDTRSRRRRLALHLIIAVLEIN